MGWGILFPVAKLCENADFTFLNNPANYEKKKESFEFSYNFLNEIWVFGTALDLQTEF